MSTRLYGTDGDDVLNKSSQGPVFAKGGNDTINVTAQNGSGQIHTYASSGDDHTNLLFGEITKFSHGHHVRGDDDKSTNRGADVFNFADTHNIANGVVIVGRIDDFDPTRDKIQIEGVDLDFANLPSNVEIVQFSGAHNDSNSAPQQWVLIHTETGGTIFYALEGARVDMDGNGGANDGKQEKHFIHEEDLPDFGSLPRVQFQDPQNYVPAGFAPDGGVIINDDDNSAADVLEAISGTPEGDLISGGLNNDFIQAGGGNDYVWGGIGRDTIYAGNGDDTIYGGQGRDRLEGGHGNDVYCYSIGDGRDTISDAGSMADTQGDTIRFGAGINAEDLTVVA